MKAKELSSDVSGPIANSIEDAESMERATSIGTGRSWVDPSVKMHVGEAIVFIFFPLPCAFVDTVKACRICSVQLEVLQVRLSTRRTSV